ncbi:putative stress-responsive transcriptional regulator [hydrocarbon metagenome]|uniref:Putative stress-responsive transcriptional regulator n=1 Tax=hydrocarbon metagenome TaxID=938273 RepID=A0A0W8FYU4_9ZZZZ
MINQQNNFENDEQKNHQTNQSLITSQRRLYRSPYNFMLLGICGGIAEYFNVSPILVRIIFVLTSLLGGWGFIFYLICAFLIPNHPTEKGKGIFKKIEPSKLWGFILVGVGIYFWLPSFGLFKIIASIDYSSNLFFAFLLFAAGFFVISYGKKSDFPNEVIKTNKLSRPIKHRRLLGVCEGFAVYMNANVNIIRISFILLSFITLGIVAVFYFVIGYLIQVEERGMVNEE